MHTLSLGDVVLLPRLQDLALLHHPLRFLQDLPNSFANYQLYTACCVFAILLAILVLKGASRKPRTVTRARLVLQALLTVVTPTQSLWPPTYASIAYRAAARPRFLVRLPLETLYKDIIQGKVELRDPRNHLPRLIQGALSTASEVSVDLDIGILCWIQLLRWFLRCSFMSSKSGLPIIPVPDEQFAQRDPSPPPPYGAQGVSPSSTRAPSSSIFLHTLQIETPAISLDCVPYHLLEPRIRELQTVLKPGAFLLIGLTTRAGPASRSFWAKETVLTALPFLPRQARRPRGKKHEEIAAQRTSTILFSSVAEVIRLLTSGAHPVTVEVVRNVSREYAQFLHRSVEELEHDAVLRSRFVRSRGMEAWVEERLCTAWEAALVDAGLLAGWAIVVRKPS